MSKRLVNLLTSLVLLLLAGCSSDDLEPLQRLELTLEQMEQAAEQKDVGEFMEFVSKQYNDSADRNWRDVRAITQINFLRNRQLHIFYHVTNYDWLDEQNVIATILVALAGQPVTDPGILQQIRADLFRFDVVFQDQEDEQWQVVSAKWQRARALDFVK